MPPSTKNWNAICRRNRVLFPRLPSGTITLQLRGPSFSCGNHSNVFRYYKFWTWPAPPRCWKLAPLIRIRFLDKDGMPRLLVSWFAVCFFVNSWIGFDLKLFVAFVIRIWVDDTENNVLLQICRRCVRDRACWNLHENYKSSFSSVVKVVEKTFETRERSQMFTRACITAARWWKCVLRLTETLITLKI